MINHDHNTHIAPKRKINLYSNRKSKAVSQSFFFTIIRVSRTNPSHRGEGLATQDYTIIKESMDFSLKFFKLKYTVD